MKTSTKTLLFMTLAVMVTLCAGAQTPGFEWTVQAGGDSSEYVYSVAVDPAGNTIMTGYFTGTAVFGSGENTVTLESNGKEDLFIQKLDPAGNLLWAFSAGDTASDYGTSICTDLAGNLYITGHFKYRMDVDPGAGVFYLDCHHDAAFILKLDAGGNLAWAKQMGYPLDFGLAWGNTIAVDAGGNVITAGNFIGRVDFNPGTGTFNLTTSGGAHDIFIQKLDANGNFLWADQIKGTSAGYPNSIKASAAGDLYLTGYFAGTADFDPAKRGTFSMTSKGKSDIFIEKLDAAGNFKWARQIGGTENEAGLSLVLDGQGFLYITGYFYSSADFNPGTGTNILTPFGRDDGFILKLDLNGNYTWAKQVGGASWDAMESIAMDAAGNIYVTGFFYETADFDPGQGTHFLTAEGKDDVYVWKSDSDGNFQWVAQMGGPGWDYGISLAVDVVSNIYTAGCFENTVDFNPGGSGTFELTAAGSNDIFLQKLNGTIQPECPVPVGLVAANITGTSADLVWSPVTGAEGYNLRYRASGIAEWVVVPIPDTSPALSLAALTGATLYEFQVKAFCGGGGSGNYSYSASFMTLGTVCTDAYEPNGSMGSASPIPVNTEITALISTGTDYDWFSFATTNAGKNVRISLTNLPADYNIRLYKSDGTYLGSSFNTGTTGEAIIYNTSKTGSYAIQVWGFGGAFDPANCYTLKAATSSTGYKDAENISTLTDDTGFLNVYPNPASTVLHVSFYGMEPVPAKIQLMNLKGQNLLSREIDAATGVNTLTLNLSVIPDGFYILELATGNKIQRKKIVVAK